MNGQQLKQTREENNNFLITNIVVNGNSEGSLLANKEYHVCYSVISNDLKGENKKIIGCFINQNDLYLEPSIKDISDNIQYFQIILDIDKQFTITELLKHTVYSRYYSNHIVKRILKNNDDVTTKKIITKCEEELKKKY